MNCIVCANILLIFIYLLYFMQDTMYNLYTLLRKKLNKINGSQKPHY